jgi:tetratricopeptide (TPR) repeat protein
MFSNTKIKILLIVLILALLVFLGRNIYINSQETKALSAFNQQDYQEAIKYYESILKFSDDTQYKINIAYNYYLLEEYQNAKEELESIKNNLNEVKDLYLLALTYEKLEEKEESLELLYGIVEKDNTYAKAFEKIGQIEKNQGNFEKAIEAYSQAISLKPQAGENYLNLAHIYFDQKDYVKEVEVYLEMITKEAVVYNNTKDESLFIAQYNLGATLYKLEEFDEAKENFENALAIKKDHGDAWYYLASINAILGNGEQMYDSLGQAIENEEKYLEIVIKDNDFRDYIETEEFNNFIKSFK